ncbi:MAG: major outer membrane protein [Arcobacter sp.]|uniref:major outer membrane protein n=1 Tax=Arcobacter sp. TaxID=1872629 RepID=UPI0025859601|nr:major outer membrane protein [Arcobacter sp.]MDD3007764.1 major outer membrane protein [Arcobacter sp.]
MVATVCRKRFKTYVLDEFARSGRLIIDFEILGEQMKKIAKLSLVAAVAVAGLTSANAQPLEEAIKNVDVSGSVVYRYNDYNNDNEPATKTDAASNNYKVALNLSSKVNDDVKFYSRFLATNNSDNGFTELKTNGGDGQANVALSNAYFGYTGITNTTVNVGKQGLTTPWTVAIDSDGNEQTGTGVLALSTVGPVTLAAAYFNQSNVVDSLDSKLGNGTALKSQIGGDLDIATVGAIATFTPVTVDAWYLNLNDTFDTYTLGAKVATEVSGIKLGADARWASLSLDKDVATALTSHLSATSELAEDNSMAKLVLTADAGLVDGKIAYAMTDKEGGLTALDNDANTTLLGWNLALNGKADADYWQAVLGFDILSNLNLSANYGNLQYIEMANSTTDIEEEEVYAQLLYKMSKNLTTYVRYGTYTKETTTGAGVVTENNDDTRGRLQVEYTF